MNDCRQGRALRILLIYGRYKFWSMGKGMGAPSFARTLEALSGRGHDVHVSLPAPVGESASVEEEFGCQLHRGEASQSFLPRASLPLPQRLWERVQCWRAYRPWARDRALEVAVKHPPDVVIGLGSYEAIPARWVGQALGIPNATRIYGVYAPDSRLKYYANFPEIASFRNPTDLFVVTNDGSGANRLAERHGVPKDRFFFLRNGFDLERFSPQGDPGAVRASLGIRPDQPLLIAVGRMASEKKLERALKMLPDLLREEPEAILALVGDGDQKEILRQLASTMGLDDHVRFPGAVTRDELPAWYRSADLFLSLLDRTNAANPTLEALSCGCPIVALNTGSTSELIEDGKTGVLVDPKNLKSLGRTIADLLRDRDGLAQMGQAASDHARKVLVSPEERLDFEVDLYETLARRGTLPEPPAF